MHGSVVIAGDTTRDVGVIIVLTRYTTIIRQVLLSTENIRQAYTTHLGQEKLSSCA
jgi:hypothetical protein